MNESSLSEHETIIINKLLDYKFLTATQLSTLTNLEIDTNYLKTLEEKHIVKSLIHSDENNEKLFFAIPHTEVDIDIKRYFQDIDLEQLDITQQDYFHIYNTVNYHILFNEYAQTSQIEINYFSSYFDAFKNKTKKNELQMSGKFELKSGDYLIPNATMNFTIPSGEEYIYALELFNNEHIKNIVQRVEKYHQILVENNYKLNRIVFIFKDDNTKKQGINHILDANILSDFKNSFIFKTVENLKDEFAVQWQLFYSKDKIDFLNKLANEDSQELNAELQNLDLDENAKPYTPPLLEEQANITLLEKKISTKDIDPNATKEKKKLLKNLNFSIKKEIFNYFLILFQSVPILIYLSSGIGAFVVSAYMEMLAFDSFYPGFFIISVVMVISFEVAKIGTIFIRIYIKNSKIELNKTTLHILNALFIPLLFGLSIVASMAVTADKLESPNAQKLKTESIKKVENQYDEIVIMTEKDHLRRAKQLKADFFEKISEFENRKKEIMKAKNLQIEKQKSVYGKDGKTWKGSKYDEHIKERKTLVSEFFKERSRLENFYNEQIKNESIQYRKEKKEDLLYKTQNLNSADSEELATSWQAQNKMVRSFIKIINYGFGLHLVEMDFIFMLSIFVSILLELTIYKVFSNVAVIYTIRFKKEKP